MRLGMTRRRRGIWIAPIAAAGLALALFAAVLPRLHAAYASAAHAYANGIATAAISEAVRETFEKYSVGEATESRANDGTVTLDTDTAAVNLINAELAASLQRRVPLESCTTMYIPLGAVTGIAALSARGVKIPVKIRPVNLVNTDIGEVFEDCGINQVRHSVSVNVEIVLACTAFMLDETETVRVSVPVTDTVIVGDVPMYYGTGASLKVSE